MNNILKLKIKYFVLFILIVISIISFMITSAKYTSKTEMSENLAIAKPIVELTSVSETSFSDLVPGETVEYYFNITNTDNSGETSEVAMNYYLKVSYENNDLPFTYEIYDVTNGNSTPLTLTSNQTDLIDLGFGNPEEHQYKIVFSWASSENADTYANKEISVNLEVFAEQVVN